MTINSIKRLIYATKSVGPSGRSILEAQVQRTKDRLNSGTDLSGNTFADYKDNRPHPGHERPLMFAARLFDDIDYQAMPGLDGSVEISGTITGEAAKIANYQNVNRKFVGFSDGDRSLSVRGIVSKIKEAGKRWR